MRGMAQKGVGTATEFTGIQQNIQNRAYMHVRRLQQTMSMVGTQLVQLNQQFMTTTQMVNLLGRKGMNWLQIEPWEIVGKCRVTCTADPNRASPEIDAQQLIGAIQVAVPLLAGQGGPAGPKLARMLFERLGVDDVDELIPPEAPGAPNDPYLENIMLENGGMPQPHPAEDVGMHLQSHAQRLAELQADGIDDATVQRFQEHQQATMAMAQQAAAQQAQAQQQGPGGVHNPQPDATQGAQPGQVQGQAQGAGGIPGAASPGPAAPAGRPLPR
jgi:hypothetical protein